jgi:integrase
MGVKMARRHERLSAKAVTHARKPGYYADGGGLYLQVSESGTKSWIFRYALAGRAREMGLGPEHTVGLAEARQRAVANRLMLVDGIDPIEARNARRAGDALNAARSITFSECATAYIKAHRSGWRNAKHAGQWVTTLEEYAAPVIGTLSVQAVDTPLVMKILEPIWQDKTQTANRLRGRIESVLDWAKAREYRTGDNPARWRGHLDQLLPKPRKVAKVEHLAALPYAQVGEFMELLRAQEGMAARALELLILTAARTGEILRAKWEEIDLNAALWTIPKARMKSHREHRVPLSPPAVKLLQDLEAKRQSDYVFPGRKIGAALPVTAMLAFLLKRMGRDDLTVHGFRSTFRDWTSERTNYPREVCEMALAHAVSDQTEAAYRRGDLFEKRRRLMAEWAKHCETKKQPGKVLPLQRKEA